MRDCQLAGLSDPGQYLGAMVIVLAARTKQFKDSNFNVLKAAFGGIRTVLETMSTNGAAKGSRSAVAVVLSPAVEKLGDRKLQVN